MKKKIKRWKKSKRVRRIRNRVEFFFMRCFTLLAWSGSHGTVIRFAAFTGRAIFDVIRIRRKVTLENLRIAFPEKPDRELRNIGRRTYQNFTMMVAEFIRLPITDNDTLLSRCTLVNSENLDWTIENGKGAVLLAGHFGNWELMSASLARMGYPMHILVNRQRNRSVDAMMNRYRMLSGNRIIRVGIAVRGILKALRKGEMVALLADQDARDSGIFIDFFGRPSSTHQGPAVFVLKTGAPIVFGSAIRLPGGRLRIENELLRFDHLKGVTPENIRMVTEAWASLLEKAIRRHPDHWFWMHKRWKSKPPVDKKNPEIRA